jgi:hypothetical protein
MVLISLHQFVVPALQSNVYRQTPVSALPITSFAISEAVSAWSVNGATLTSTDTAASLFGASLFPYLVLLFFLSRPETKTPRLGNFGFQFLLAFVFATIPAGIYAKLQYHDILANVDWLHGGAESLLTLTNLFIIFGFREGREKPTNSDKSVPSLNSFPLATAAALIMAGGISSGIAFHLEPTNAFSIPTWMVHASSLLEWLIAMKLIFEHADKSGNPAWKGLTWGMAPSHASGLCACTFHLFYNTPALNWMVVLQSFLTLFGNSTMAFAAYRVYAYEKDRIEKGIPETPAITLPPLEENDNVFLLNMFIKSLILSVIVKYGELAFDFPFQVEANTLIAASFIVLPTAANIVKWKMRSSSQA